MVGKGLCYLKTCGWRLAESAAEPPVPPVPMTIWVSQSFALSGSTRGYIDTVLTFAWDTARVLSEQIQALYPYSGSAYFGSNYTFWVAVPTGDPPPSGWEINPDPGGDPGLRIPVEWNESSSFSTLYCLQKTFTVDDATSWYLYYFTSVIGNSESTSFPFYSDMTEAALIDSVKTAFGLNATAALVVAGNDITIKIYDIPFNAVSAASWDGLVDPVIENLALIDCP